MTVEIKRCFFGRDIQAQAVSLKESIEGKLKISTRIRLGGPGAVDVFVDREINCSKKRVGRRRPSTRSLSRFATAGEAQVAGLSVWLAPGRSPTPLILDCVESDDQTSDFLFGS